jgi:putative transposase
LSISRSSFYYSPLGAVDTNLALMLLIDKQFLDTPVYGVRQMIWHLRNDGHSLNEKRIRRLMRLTGLMPIYQAPNTSKHPKGHNTYPYPLRGLRVDRPNQVWCADITYIPMKRGFLYLVAIMDWRTRKALVWRISNTQKADVCVEALNEAIHRFGAPDIMNTDQGSQFTPFAWTDRLKRAGCRISMDGQGRCIDNPRAFLRTDGSHALDHRKALAIPEVRMRLPVLLGDRFTGQGRHCPLVDILQPPPPAFIAWRHPARRVLSSGNQRNPTRSAGAKSSLTYAGNCPTNRE